MSYEIACSSLFTPEQIRQDGHYPHKRARIRYAGKRRWIRYKVVPGLLWQRSSATHRLRLVVVAPQPYNLSKRRALAIGTRSIC